MSAGCESRCRSRRRWVAPAVAAMMAMAVPVVASTEPADAVGPVTFTILHTNDFHGNLERSGSNPGAARVAQKIADVRATVGDENLLVVDAGDIMQGSLLSNLQQGLPTIDYYRTIGYDVATFGNHEFDWGRSVLGDRIAQAESPALGDESPMQMVAANITTRVGDTCTWDSFDAAVAPYEVLTVGTAPDTARVAVIGVGSVETPFITIASATAGLCFRDPFETISNYYAEMDAASDVIVVLSHNGFTDGGYGYGFTVYGDQTLAQKLIAAGTPVDLIVGGHSHTDLTAATVIGPTTVVQAHYAGRKVGRADITYDPATDAVTVNWQRIVVGTSDPQYPPVEALVSSYVSDPAYQALVNQPVGYVQMDLTRNYEGDAIMGDFVDDAIYGALNGDAEPANDVDLFLNNPGGIRTDWCDVETSPGVWGWSSTGCQMEGVWTHDPMLLTYGMMFSILPFGNATAVGTMTGAQLHELLQQAAGPANGRLQPSGVRYTAFEYQDPPVTSPVGTGYPYAWGAYGIEVYDRASGTWQALDPARTYRVGTNEFLAPAGQDGFTAFKYLTDVTYWGDMLNAVNAYVAANYTFDAPYRGPDGDGTLDGRITKNGDGDYAYEPGEIVPLTVLHHNDSHGRLLKSGTTPGYSQLVTLINQERAHNPDRTLLVSSGDNIQGDSTMYYFKSAGLGYASDGTPLPPEMSINPLIKAFNAVGYDAWTLGNHEFNFGRDVFATLSQADFPVLQANVSDTGAYGLSTVPVEPYTETTVGPEGIDVAILGIGNHRVPSYELPSNIAGLTFSDPVQTGRDLAPGLQATNDVVIALTHIGFTENPASIEVDTNVDTYFAGQVSGVDAVIGGHSHTRPDTGFGPYRYLPAFVAGPDGEPVLVTQAYRYNTFLGEVVLGLLPDGSGGYEVASSAGRAIPVTSATVEDPTIVGLVQPYQTMITAYNDTLIGSTTAPIDTLQAYTQETNGANLQADASVWKLASEGIDVDVHLSGAMTNSRIAASATTATPYQLKVSDMFTAMPYENSLVVMEMNGPQLKRVLERAYRNYYFYKYVPGYGGYSYYTTCMLDTDAGNQIVYRDENPTMPDGDNVAALLIGGAPVDFTDADTYYRVSSVNYLAAGACNFSDAGASLWPLDQIVADTQYYVRDAVIEYVDASTGPISPAIEGRLVFTPPPAPTVSTPVVTPEPSIIGRSVTASATFTDPGVIHGPLTCTVTFGDGRPAVTGSVDGNTCTATHRYWWYGTYDVTVDVADAIGTTGTASAAHTVVFDYSGPYPPLAATGNVATAGSTIPVKFSLGWFFGTRILATGSPTVVPCAGGTAVPASGSLHYDWWSGKYVFTWKTAKSWKGTCQAFTFTLVDGTTHRIEVRFR